jgi:hypothetical protein
MPLKLRALLTETFTDCRGALSRWSRRLAHQFDFPFLDCGRLSMIRLASDGYSAAAVSQHSASSTVRLNLGRDWLDQIVGTYPTGSVRRTVSLRVPRFLR